MQLKSLSQGKLKVAIWIGILVLLALVIAQLFRSINADQLGAQSPGIPQYPLGAAINGVTVLDASAEMSYSQTSASQGLAYSSGAGLLTYDCDTKGVGATVAVYPDDVTEAVATATTDSRCEYFTDIPPSDSSIICAFAAGEPVAKSVSEIFPVTERTKCSERPITEHEDNYVDLGLIVTPAGMKIGILHVIGKTAAGAPAFGAKAKVKCDDGTAYPEQAIAAPDGKAIFGIQPPEQNCLVTVTDYKGKVDTKTVYVKTHPPVTEVTFTLDAIGSSPITQFFHKILGVETAHAATTKMTVNRNTNKQKAATAPKAVTQGRIAGKLYEDDGNGNIKAITRPVALELILTSPAGLDNVTGLPVDPQYSVKKATSNDGSFDFNPVEFTVNTANTYKIQISDPAFEATPTRVVVLGLGVPNGQIVLSKLSKFNNVVNPYKQNGIQIYAQSKDVPTLKGNAIINDVAKTPYTGKFNIVTPAAEYSGVSSFNYKGNGYPVLNKEYRILFTIPDADIELIGYFDGDTDQPLKTTAQGKIALVTLTEAKKDVTVVVKVKQKITYKLSGEAAIAGVEVLPSTKGTFTITSPSGAPQIYENTNKFTYNNPQPNIPYTVHFKPDRPDVMVEGYYSLDDIKKKIDPPVFTLTEANPSIGVLVKLKKATTTLEVGLNPPDPTAFKSVTLNQEYIAKLTKAGDKQAIDTILNFAEGIAKRFIGTNIISNKTFVHLHYRIPNAGIGIKVGNKNIGTTNESGKKMVEDANEWVDEDPEIQAVEGTLPACIHIHSEIKAGGVIKLKEKSTYTPVTVTLNKANPVIGKLVSPDPRKIVGGKANIASIDKNDFKPENFTMTGGQKNLGDGSNFYTHEQKLQRCMDGKSIEAPKINASFDIPPSVKDAEETTLKLGVNDTNTATIKWSVTEEDGSPITDPEVKTTIQIKAGKSVSPEQPVGPSGTQTQEVKLDGGKEQNYTITIRVRRAQSTEEVTKTLKIKIDKKK